MINFLFNFNIFFYSGSNFVLLGYEGDILFVYIFELAFVQREKKIFYR